MSLRRQAYEWRNLSDGGTTSFLNGYPVLWTNNANTVGFSANQPVDVFIGDIGNNIDIPGQLKAFQYIVLDAVAVFPPTLHAQIYVGTSRYFQDPDNVPSNQVDISWLANNLNAGGSILMFPSPILVLFQQPLGVTVTTNSVITGVASDANNRTVVIDLIGELAIQKAPPGYRGV